MTPEQARAAFQNPQADFVIGRRVIASLAMNANIRRQWAAGIFGGAREALIQEAERIEASLKEAKRLWPEAARELEIRAAMLGEHHARS